MELQSYKQDEIDAFFKNTDDYVKEIIRPAYLSGDEDKAWFGVPNKQLTRDAVLKDLNGDN